MMLKPIIQLVVKGFIVLAILGLINQRVNSNEKPAIEINADFAEFDDKKGTVIYQGNVVMSQGNRQLTSDTLVIQRDSHGKINFMIATGSPAHFQIDSEPEKPLSHGQSNTIKYFPNQDKILFIGNAELTQNTNTVYGDKLSYFLKTRVLSSELVPGKRTTVILPSRSSQ
jgi:lipopolysaccharide export system protein LptA